MRPAAVPSWPQPHRPADHGQIREFAGSPSLPKQRVPVHLPVANRPGKEGPAAHTQCSLGRDGHRPAQNCLSGSRPSDSRSLVLAGRQGASCASAAPSPPPPLDRSLPCGLSGGRKAFSHLLVNITGADNIAAVSPRCAQHHGSVQSAYHVPPAASRPLASKPH